MNRLASLPTLILLALLGAARADDSAKDTFQIDVKASELRLHVKKKGALKAFAHDHDMVANVFTGSVTWSASAPERASVSFEVATKDIAVLDPQLSASDRASVLKTMQSDEVLDVVKYPRIAFHSTSVVVKPKTADGKQPLAVVGRLALHGTSKQATLDVVLTEKDGVIEVTGEHPLKQSDYGMEPYSTGLGSIGVQDVIEVTFRITAKK